MGRVCVSVDVDFCAAYSYSCRSGYALENVSILFLLLKRPRNGESSFLQRRLGTIRWSGGVKG